ncbi:MAG: hypothetical protein V5A31_10160 [Haloferacaceae archaeon]
MAKVSIGLRGWRFDETDVFGPDGGFRSLDEMPADDRERLVRLVDLVERPCSACYLRHGEIQPCRQATVVYGEPGSEVLLCDAHEADFVYWYREAGGSAHRGEASLRTAFHDWFDDGGRAPEGYAGLEHVETDPDNLPDPPDAEELRAVLEQGVELERVSLRPEALADDEDDGGEPLTTADLARTDLDLDAEYPGDG